MNITLTRGNNDSKLNRASYRIAAMVAACTLAIAGVIGLSGAFSSASTGSAPVARSAAARAAVTQPSQPIVLVVDSAEAKARMDADIAMDSILTGMFDGRPEYIVVVKGTELEDSLTSAASPVQQSGKVPVIDTTVPPFQTSSQAMLSTTAADHDAKLAR